MKYFTIEEFRRSAKADELGIDNSVPPAAAANIRVLTETVLDPLRQAWGRPLTVTSGYRCAALNKAVGGASNSHHMRGMAADVSTGNVIDNRRLFQLVLDLKLPFTQLIDERGFSWVHISYDPADVRMQVLKI